MTVDCSTVLCYPVELFIAFIAIPVFMALFGFIRQPQIPAMLAFGGIFVLFLAVTTYGITTGNIIEGSTINQTQVVLSNTTDLFYSVQSGVSIVNIRDDGVASFAFTEYATDATSQLVGETLQCISVELLRVGSPILNSNIEVGVMGTTSNFIQFYGNISASSVSSGASDYYTVCVAEGSERTIQAGDRIGFKYRYGNSTHYMVTMEDTGNPYDGTITIRSSMVSTTWANSATRDANMQMWNYIIVTGINDTITNDNQPSVYEFTEIPKIFLALIGVVMMLCGALMVSKD